MKRFNWEKLGKVFDPTASKFKRSWLEEFAQAPCTLIFEDFVRVYFSCRPKRDSNGQYVSYSAFVDLDKDNLFNIKKISEQPILELGKLGTFDEFGTYPVSVINYREDYYCYYAGWTRCESVPFNVAIGMGISKNGGETFMKLGDGPVLGYDPEEPFIISGPKIRRFKDQFYLFYIAGKKWILSDGKPEPVYTIRMAMSQDGINWKKYGSELIPSKVELNESQASPDVFYRNGLYHMFFSYRKSKNYRGKTGSYRIGYAYSDDLFNWNRNDDLAGIDISDDGFDNEMVAYPHIFELNNELYMLYLGNEVGRFGFGLARLNET